MKSKPEQIQEVKDAISRYEANYAAEQNPELKKQHWETLCYLREKAKQLNPNQFRKLRASLAA